MVPTLTEVLGKEAAQRLAAGGAFKPCATYYPAMDMLLYLERDCPYRAVPVAGSNVELLLAPDTSDAVGVKIPLFSRVVSSNILLRRGA